MYLHSIAVHFAVALFVVAMICEALTQFTGKRFWKLVTKYQLAAAAVSALLAVITGFYDFSNIWATDFGLSNLKTHLVMGVDGELPFLYGEDASAQSVHSLPGNRWYRTWIAFRYSKSWQNLCFPVWRRCRCCHGEPSGDGRVLKETLQA